ncbi:sensor histidine kinase [Caulobacter vibrioides]|nr:sensor histidine kinase [Caulobacter vibrioides]
MNTASESSGKTKTGASHSDAPGAEEPPLRRHWSVVFLVYLPFYFISWLYRRPGELEVAASMVGLVVFLGLFASIHVRKRPPALWQVLAVFGVGLALSPFKSTWTVYTIYAMAYGARLAPRRLALRTMIGMELVVLAIGVVFLRDAWSIWASGLLFGAITGFATLMQADIERKNEALAIAHEEVRALASTAERERISRDLHDLLGHTLTLVAVKAELAARLVSRDPAAAEREMQAVAATAREALSEVRTAVVGMKGASLAFELDKARQALAAGGVEATVSALTTDGHPGQEAVLAMALREGVTNVIRHAGASRCDISLTPSASALVLTIADNGQGGRLVEGSGLKGMRARLAAIGGTLDVKSDKAGTRLVATAPLRAQGEGVS